MTNDSRDIVPKEEPSPPAQSYEPPAAEDLAPDETVETAAGVKVVTAI
jgi:hypothetical protein